MEERKLFLKVWDELAQEKSMVFMVGPRQAGKTTLAQIISGSFINSLCFNWDIPDHRTKFFSNPNFFEDVIGINSSSQEAGGSTFTPYFTFGPLLLQSLDGEISI